jgi:hypothetical protein
MHKVKTRNRLDLIDCWRLPKLTLRMRGRLVFNTLMCAPAMERKQKTQKDPTVQVLSDDRAEGEKTCMAVEMPLILPMIQACLSLFWSGPCSLIPKPML